MGLFERYIHAAAWAIVALVGAVFSSALTPEAQAQERVFTFDSNPSSNTLVLANGSDTITVVGTPNNTACFTVDNTGRVTSFPLASEPACDESVVWTYTTNGFEIGKILFTDLDDMDGNAARDGFAMDVLGTWTSTTGLSIYAFTDTSPAYADQKARFTNSGAVGTYLARDTGNDPLNDQAQFELAAPAITFKMIHDDLEGVRSARVFATLVGISVYIARPIVANAESFPSINGATGGSTTTVLASDTFDDAPINASDVTITVGTSDPELSLNPANGQITVAPNTTAGTYNVTYTICENAYTGNCSTVTETVQVTTPPPGVVNCGTESQGTGSGYASGGTGIYRDKIFWFDWSCGGVTQYNPGDTVNKSWVLPSGLTVTAQITNITAAIHPYTTGTYSGDTLDDLYSGVNPIGLSNQISGEDPTYDVTFSSNINGTQQKVNLVVSEAESTDGTESATWTTNGLPWQPIEANGNLSARFSNGGQTLEVSENGTSGDGTLLTLTESVSTVSVDMQAGGKEALAYGVIIEFDFGDAPTGYADTGGHYVPTGASGGSQSTSYTLISNMTMGTLSYGGDYRMGTNPTDTETADIHSANADGDDTTGGNDEDAATIPALIQGQSETIPVVVNQPSADAGHLQAWIDWNGDEDFDDPNEHIANGLQFSGGVTGSINIPVNVPSDAVTTQTIARFRWSSEPTLNSTEIGSDGEIADFALTVQAGTAELDANKTVAVYDPTNTGLYALPGNDVIYTIRISNIGTGAADTDTIELIDSLPSDIEFWNGDIDAGGPDTYPGTDPVGFTQPTGTGMSLTYGTDVRFGTGGTAPADFSACTAVAQDNTYRPDLTYICFNPKGTLAAGDPDPEIELSFRARIK